MFISSCRSIQIRNSSNVSPIFSIPSNISKTIQSNKIDGEWIINSISLIIFVLALLGNMAALVVMFGSRGPIRLTNNKYLVNLACADLLRACFMPFTILARMKRNFMFGPIICKVLPIVQGLSVAVDVFTLVCISVERYIAICRPLLILQLQSLRFASLFNGLIIFLIWLIGLLTALPNIPMYNLCSLPKPGRFKCEKVNPEYFDEKIYMVALVVFYFLAPMLIMLILYTLIICKMYKNNTAMRMRSFQSSYPSKSHSTSSSPPMNRPKCPQICDEYHQFDINDHRPNQQASQFGRLSSLQSSGKSRSGFSDDELHGTNHSPRYTRKCRRRSKSNPILRQTSRENRKNPSKSNSSPSHSNRSRLSSTNQYRIDRHRRKALKLLIIIILEFFICWTPIFIYHTFGTFDKRFYRSMPNFVIDLILLFSFASDRKSVV